MAVKTEMAGSPSAAIRAVARRGGVWADYMVSAQPRRATSGQRAREARMCVRRVCGEWRRQELCGEEAARWDSRGELHCTALHSLHCTALHVLLPHSNGAARALAHRTVTVTAQCPALPQLSSLNTRTVLTSHSAPHTLLQPSLIAASMSVRVPRIAVLPRS